MRPAGLHEMKHWNEWKQCGRCQLPGPVTQQRGGLYEWVSGKSDPRWFSCADARECSLRLRRKRSKSK